MTTDVAAIIAIAMMAVLLASGMPIAVGLGIAGAVGIFLIKGVLGLMLVPATIYGNLDTWTLVAIPLFVLMAQTVVVMGLGSDLFTAGQKWLSRLSGGLALTTIGTCTAFAACSGSVSASVAGIGSVAVPEMIKRGYSPRLAAGCVGGAGGLATVIPPSIGFIIYGWIAETSVGKLFIAGVIPGLLMAIGYTCVVITWVKLRPSAAPAVGGYPWRERWQSLVTVWPVIFLIFAVLGLIYTGVCTPTEAGGTGAVTALLTAGLYYRKLGWQNFKTIVSSTVRITSQIGIIIAGAMIFGHFVALAQISEKLTLLVTALPVSPIVIMISINVMFFVLGCFMDVIAIQLVFVPPLIPIARMLGFDLVWFGVLVTQNCELAGSTPPFGINLFILKSIVPEVSLGDIVRGNLPFILSDIFVLALVIAFPVLALWLPGTM